MMEFKLSLHIRFPHAFTRIRLPHCVAIFYNLPWFSLIKVSNKKSQRNAENACGNRMCKRVLTLLYANKVSYLKIHRNLIFRESLNKNSTLIEVRDTDYQVTFDHLCSKKHL
jgi:hypothetical protein